MKTPKKPGRKTEGLSNAIQSLQHLLDDVGAAPATPILKPGEVAFEETGEFEITSAQDAVDIDSHFDMSIPPDLPEDEFNQTDNIPTLSESIVEGEIPVLMEAVKLPQDSTPVFDEGTEPAIADATEAAGDAVQIILKRYHQEQLSQEARQRLEQQVRQLLENEMKETDYS